MKKFIVSIVCIACFLPLYPQGLSFSVFFEPQISWLTADVKTITRDAVRGGFNTGLIMDKYFADNYAFSTGISIWNTGGSLLYQDSTMFDFNYEASTIMPNSVMTYKTQYINIPLSLKLNSNEIGYIRFFAHPGINTHINIKAVADVMPEAMEEIENENISDAINPVSMSYFIGAGIEYSLGGNTALILGMYYQSGFWDITKTEDYKVTMGSLSLRLGVKF
jgi:hypothetical protein